MGRPFNVQKLTHVSGMLALATELQHAHDTPSIGSQVDANFEWSGEDLTKTFEVEMRPHSAARTRPYSRDGTQMKEKLGEGAFGAVYRAVHRQTGFALAVKMVRGASAACAHRAHLWALR